MCLLKTPGVPFTKTFWPENNGPRPVNYGREWRLLKVDHGASLVIHAPKCDPAKFVNTRELPP